MDIQMLQYILETNLQPNFFKRILLRIASSKDIDESRKKLFWEVYDKNEIDTKGHLAPEAQVIELTKEMRLYVSFTIILTLCVLQKIERAHGSLVKYFPKERVSFF